MSAPEQPRDPLATAQGLRDALTGMAKELKYLRRFGRHNRMFIVVDIVLTVALTLFGSLAVRAAQDAARADSAQLALCRAGNVSRHQQLGLWLYLFKLAGPAPTPAARKLDAEFEHHLVAVFKSRNCMHLGQRSAAPTPLPPVPRILRPGAQV